MPERRVLLYNYDAKTGDGNYYYRFEITKGISLRKCVVDLLIPMELVGLFKSYLLQPRNKPVCMR
jgi:hypothetical protein